MVFSSYAVAGSEKARALAASGTEVIGSGQAGVEGKQLIDILGDGMGYRVIMMATGPGVLALLLDAQRLDLFYLTQVQVEIPFDDPSEVKRLLPGGKPVDALTGFRLSRRYVQEGVVTEDGSLISQEFLRYDSTDLKVR
jgi:hypothetical protein